MKVVHLIFLVFVTSTAAQVVLNSACTQPMKEGPCDAVFLRYFYNTTTHTCQHFIYGGCSANANNFLTMQDCLNHCVYPVG